MIEEFEKQGNSSITLFLIMTVYLILFLVISFINVIAWTSSGFADWYVSHVFPLWGETYGRLTGLFPFSVGEWMLYGFVVLLFFSAGAAVILGIRFLIWRAKPGRFFLRFYRGVAWLLLVVYLIMTLNCLILYHTNPFADKILPKETARDYTVEELVQLRNRLVAQANELCEQMERDENGAVIYYGDAKAQAVSQMQRLGEEIVQLQGYYPNPKGLFFSGFFSQQYILGYYFPFSMEANYNTQMYIMNEPATFCHELSHLKGVLFEDDANFISYLACSTSDDKFFQYSAVLSVLGYVDEAFFESLSENVELYYQYPLISEQVCKDSVFLTEEAWAAVEENAILSTETVSKASHAFLDTNLTLNGVEEGIASYGNVVWLLLRYYDTMD